MLSERSDEVSNSADALQQRLSIERAFEKFYKSSHQLRQPEDDEARKAKLADKVMRQYDDAGDNSAAQKTTAGEETILQAGCDDQSQQWKGFDEGAED